MGGWRGSHSFGFNKKDHVWEGAVKMHLSPKSSLASLQRDYSCGPYSCCISWEDVVLSQKRSQRKYTQACIREGSPQDGEKKAVGRTTRIGEQRNQLLVLLTLLTPSLSISLISPVTFFYYLFSSTYFGFNWLSFF